jgi:TolA-binding protein
VRIVIASLALGLTTAYGLFAQEFALDSTRRADVSARLAPTAHPALPATPSEYWFVGEGRATAARGETAAGRLARGATLIADEEFASALALVNPAALTGSPLAPYAQYYRALALQGLSRAAEADGILTALVESRPEGHLREAAAMALADVALARGDGERAENLLEELAGEKLRAPEAALLTLAMAEESIGHRDHALDAYARVYYDFPLSTEATDAQEGIESLAGSTTLSLPDRFARELKRAEALFAARRWAQSRAAFQALAGAAQGDTRELIALRLAEAD